MRGAMSLIWLVAVAGVFAVVSAAPTEYEGTSFSQVLNRARGVSASTTSGDYYPHEHHVCLREYRQRECRIYGCDNIQPCTGTCTDCRIGDHYTSDMQCCHHHEAYGYYGQQETIDTNGWLSTHVGGCDWNFMWLRNYGGCGWVNVVPGKVWKVGTATAECNFGHSSEECGEPLCGNTKVTLQGTIYATEAYSLQETTLTGGSTNNCYNWYYFDQDRCDGVGLAPWSGNRRVSGDRNATGQTPSSLSTPSTATIQNVQDSYGSGDQPLQAYRGSAIVITGGITSVSGGEKKHKAKWEDGSFQYVPFFYRYDDTLDTVNDDTIPWVKSHTYRFTFEEEENEYYQNEVSLAGGTKN